MMAGFAFRKGTISKPGGTQEKAYHMAGAFENWRGGAYCPAMWEVVQTNPFWENCTMRIENFLVQAGGLARQDPKPVRQKLPGNPQVGIAYQKKEMVRCSCPVNSFFCQVGPFGPPRDGWAKPFFVVNYPLGKRRRMGGIAFSWVVCPWAVFFPLPPE